ncbi:hypothetical protein GCM10023079_47660 [Streptomyces chitinivorans]
MPALAYCSAVICSCIHAGATGSAVMGTSCTCVADLGLPGPSLLSSALPAPGPENAWTPDGPPGYGALTPLGRKRR